SALPPVPATDYVFLRGPASAGSGPPTYPAIVDADLEATSSAFLCGPSVTQTSDSQSVLNNINKLNKTVYVGRGIATWSGSDLGQQINDAYTNGLPAEGGTIVILAGDYTFSHGIQLATSGKWVCLAGQPGSSVNLTYTGSGSAILLDYVPA